MKLWVCLLLLPALALSLRAGVGRGRRGGREESKGGGQCKDGDSQPHLSLTDRTQQAQVVFYGFVTRLYKRPGRRTYPAEFFIVNVFKGAHILAKLLKVDAGYGGVYNLRDKRVNVTNFGPRKSCLSPLEEQRTFIILANSKSGRKLKAYYGHPAGAAVQWSKENEEEVWKALGWDGWSDWSGCSASCGGGTQERRRYCLFPQGCQGYNTERRRCNYFSCNGTMDVLHLEERRYKPTRFGWRESSTRPGSWRAVRNRPLLLHTRDLYPEGFPKEFSLLITVRPDLGNHGMLFIMHRAYGGEVYLGLGLGTGLELLHTGPGPGDDVLPINVAPINVNITDGHWHQLAISILQDSSIQVYVDCRWTSRQILRRSTLQIPMDTLLYVGGMPGRSYQGEMEQFTISRSPDAVAKQCKPEPIPIIDKTLQDTGLPLSFVLHDYNNNNKINSNSDNDNNNNNDNYDNTIHQHSDKQTEEYGDYDEYDDEHTEDYEDDVGDEDEDSNRYSDDDDDDNDEYDGDDDNDDTSHQDGDIDYDDQDTYIDYYYDQEGNYEEDYEYDSHEDGGRRKEKNDRNEKGNKRNDMKEMTASAFATQTDDEDMIEGSGREIPDRFLLSWSVWSGCSTSCDGGVRIRSYRCKANHPSFEECVNAGIETQEQRACNLHPCPATTTPVASTTTPSTVTISTTSTTATSSNIASPKQPDMTSNNLSAMNAVHHISSSVLYTSQTATTTPPTTTHDDHIITSPTLTTLPPIQSTTTPRSSKSDARHTPIKMHPLFPTTVVNTVYHPLIESHFNKPVSEPYFNSTHRFYPDGKTRKPSKTNKNKGNNNNVWAIEQREMERKLNEVEPQSDNTDKNSNKRFSWNRKWSYHHQYRYHSQQQPQQLQQDEAQHHRMRHNHGKYDSTLSETADCGCLNHGLCGYGGVCHCTHGWHGQYCEVAECRRPCHNGGACVAPGTCHCPAGYTGPQCHDVVCSHGCGVGGVCVGVEKCRCGHGYTGPSCTTPVCDPPCSNGGTCVSPGVCSCPEGFSGHWCNVRRKCRYVPRQVAYTRSYKKAVPQRVHTHCGAWGWKTCTSVRNVYQTVTQKFYRTVYTCSNAP